ncbi:hypothetical protein L6164_031361 [Bauhinia variegata]|uniref:Uncharacterized protein n=1 Tax=Bauhinia variegata TaxID=167791 RepID=A0ACB9LES3_BAUVA|nr:hypothetical protein L6164_031361 [Bauhinia variegata]
MLKEAIKKKSNVLSSRSSTINLRKCIGKIHILTFTESKYSKSRATQHRLGWWLLDTVRVVQFIFFFIRCRDEIIIILYADDMLVINHDPSKILRGSVGYEATLVVHSANM